MKRMNTRLAFNRQFALRALWVGLFIEAVALLFPDLIGGAVPYLLERSLDLPSLRASTIGIMFVVIIAVRGAILWQYTAWATDNGIFRMRVAFSSMDDTARVVNLRGRAAFTALRMPLWCRPR